MSHYHMAIEHHDAMATHVVSVDSAGERGRRLVATAPAPQHKRGVSMDTYLDAEGNTRCIACNGVVEWAEDMEFWHDASEECSCVRARDDARAEYYGTR